MDINKIPTLEELRKRFPIGTKVYPTHVSDAGYFVISTNNFKNDDDCYAWATTLNNDYNEGNDLENGTLYDKAFMRTVWSKYNGFAKIHSENKIYELWV